MCLTHGLCLLFVRLVYVCICTCVDKLNFKIELTFDCVNRLNLKLDSLKFYRYCKLYRHGLIESSITHGYERIRLFVCLYPLLL